MAPENPETFWCSDDHKLECLFTFHMFAFTKFKSKDYQIDELVFTVFRFFQFCKAMFLSGFMDFAVLNDGLETGL